VTQTAGFNPRPDVYHTSVTKSVQEAQLPQRDSSLADRVLH